MDNWTAMESAFKNGYEKGYEQGRKDGLKEFLIEYSNQLKEVIYNLDKVVADMGEE